MTRTKVQIEKETKKAYLVADSEGRKGWIQKRWLDSGSTVNSKTFDRAVENYNQNQAAYEQGRQWSNDYHSIIEFAKETEKAVAVKIWLDFCDVEKTIEKLLWVPKSIIRDNAVPGWFLLKKFNEILDEYRMDFSRYGSVIIDSVDVADCEDCYAI
ncbi:MAG: hypothetical protein GWN94_19815 [Phycisphaerae bacterium]|nr:hypothetical protein [Phycisphaerae bacterium]NIS53321.1 hypothetical protein [Phycisphaerae bacterium]NIX30475.1 hypothetical protein [Phycisphaerae bacterium]